MRQLTLIQKASLVGCCIFIFIMMMETGVCLAAQSCHFTQAASTFPFGNLDPFSSANATTTLNISIICDKKGPWWMTSDNGLHYDGTTKRMRHQTMLTEYVPYAVTFSPTHGKEKILIITGSGTILNSSYINAYAGNYEDTITLTITP